MEEEPPWVWNVPQQSQEALKKPPPVISMLLGEDSGMDKLNKPKV